MNPTRRLAALALTLPLLVGPVASLAESTVREPAEDALPPAPPADAPIARGLQLAWAFTRDAFVGDARAMPASGYSVRPAEGMRDFAEQVAHAAETLLVVCESLQGRPDAVPGFVPGRPGPSEVRWRERSEVLAFVDRAVASCDQAFAGLDDRQLAGVADLGGRPTPASLLVALALAHTQHHDGSAVVYLRAQGIVPPASRPAVESTPAQGGE